MSNLYRLLDSTISGLPSIKGQRWLIIAIALLILLGVGIATFQGTTLGCVDI